MLCLPRDVNSADGLQPPVGCLLYTSDAADDLIGVDLGGRRIIKKKNKYIHSVKSVRRSPIVISYTVSADH